MKCPIFHDDSRKAFCIEIMPVVLAIVLLYSTAASHAQEAPAVQPQTSSWFIEDVSAVKPETAGVFLAATALGFSSWDWGTRSDFAAHSEGWFGYDTEDGGMDKLGHAFTSYLITNILTERLLMQGRTTERAACTSAILATLLQLYVEVFDGFSREFGFSYEDMTMNVFGAAVAYLRQAVPGMRDVVDLRLNYWPSGDKGFDPVGDYSGQKFLFAFKLSGISALGDTPLRYVELHTGYYARGFNDVERSRGEEKSRRLFAGIGINLTELFFGPRKISDSGWQRLGRGFFEHVQIPYTAVRSGSSY